MPNPPRTIQLMAACVALPFWAVFSAAADDNRLKNPGAETASAEDKSRPADWFAAQVPAEGLVMRLDDKTVRAGKASLFIENTHVYQQGTFNNWAQQVEGLKAGETFTLSGWVRTERAENVTLCVQAWDEGGKNLVAFATSEPAMGTREWQLMKSKPITIPSSAKLIIARAGLGGKGRVWFDELRLTPGDGARFPDPPAEVGANLLKNAGAETVDPQDASGAADWFKAQVPAQGLSMERTTEGARGGKAALYISNTHAYEQMVCNNWTQAVEYNLAGRFVRLSAWVKTEDAENVSLCVQGFTDLVNMSAFGSTESLKGTRDWVQIHTEPVRIGPNVTMVTVRAVLTGRGKVWFDDLTLEIVNDDAIMDERGE